MEDQSIYWSEMEARIVGLKSNTAFNTEITGTPATLDLFTRAEGYKTEKDNWQQKLVISSKAYTKIGQDKKDENARVFSDTAAVMKSYGEKITNADLMNLKKMTFTKLMNESVKQQLIDNNYILGLIEIHKTPLIGYKIDTAYKANLVALTADLESLCQLPLAVIEQHANDKKTYENMEKNAKKFYDAEMDPYMRIYRNAMVSLFLAYTASRRVRHHHLKRKPKVIDPETTTGILEIMLLFKASMDPAAGANYFISGLGISGTTDEDGETYDDELKPGTYHGKISMEGYKDIEFDFTIEAGKTCALQFLLEVADVAPSGTPGS